MTTRGRKPKRPTPQSTQKKPDLSAGGLVKLAMPRLRLFCTMGGEPYAQAWAKNEHWETYSIRSRDFGEWLIGMAFNVCNLPPTLSAVESAKATLAAQAKMESEKEVCVRVAEGRSGEVVIDLGNKEWNAVVITGKGYRVDQAHPAVFRRPTGFKSLPEPVAGGSIDELRQFLNLQDEDQWILTVGFLLGSLRPKGPYPVGIIEGPHGSAKTTATKVLRKLLDPNVSEIRAEPSAMRDLMITANNSHCLTFDNLSHLPVWLADAFCRLSTGGGFATRLLYSNDEEQIFDAARPVLINGIDMGIERGDLLDRAVTLSLAVIPDSRRRSEARFWKEFEAAQARILGALYELVANGLRRLPEIRIPNLPRMADFAAFVCAVEPSLGWPEGTFLGAYQRNMEQSNSVTLENSGLADPIVLLVQHGPWEGTATELRFSLANADYGEGRSCTIPDSPKKLAADLRRLEPNLKKVGIIVEYKRTAGSDSKRIITIHRPGGHAAAMEYRSE